MMNLPLEKTVCNYHIPLSSIIINMHRMTSVAECVGLWKTVLKSMYSEGCSKIICFPISIEAARQYWHLLFLFYQNDFKDEQNHW